MSSTTPHSSPTTDSLTTTTAQAQKAYSTKDYSTAVSLYATACELQAQLHGSEDDPRNAHLLYLYGKALYQVAVSKSDILGGAAMKQEADPDANEAADGDRDRQGNKDQKDKKKAVESRSIMDAELAMAMARKGGLFSFQGDENWDNSDDEEGEEGDEGDEVGDEVEGMGQAEGGDGGGGGSGDRQESPNGEGEGGAEEEDDMANAWEVLDLARVLFHKTLDPTRAPNTPLDAYTTPTTPSSVLASPTPTQVTEQRLTSTTTLKTQLADVYDLLGEISLESEAFNQAVDDLRSSLQLKLSLFPPHNKLVSEAHYKLSLALEFASAMESVPDEDATKLRHGAVEQMSLAIESVKRRIVIEEQEQEQDSASSSTAGSDKDKGKGKRKEQEEDEEGKGKDEEKKKRSLQEAREIVAELEQRLVDLRALLVQTPESQNPLISDLLLKSVLGTAGDSGSSSSGGSRKLDPAEQKRKLDETVKQAKDVSNLVRKKPKVPLPVEVVESSDNTTTTATHATVGVGVGGTGAGSLGKAAGKRKLVDIEMLDIQGKVIPTGVNGSGGTSGGAGSKKVKVEDSLDEEEKDGGSAAIS